MQRSGRTARGRSALALAALLAGAAGALRGLSFVGAARRTATPARGRVQVHFFGSPAGSGKGQLAYDAFVEEFPEAAERGSFLGEACDQGSVSSKFQSLSGLVGEDVALDLIQKEPVLLTRPAASVRASYQYLKDQETPEEPGKVLDILVKNPKVLTISATEFQRTKTDLAQLSSAAGVIALLRPLGPWGITFALFGGFAVVLVFLRPILYGANGGQSIVSVVTSPITTPLAGLVSSLPNPNEVLDGIYPGLNMSVFVGLYAVFVVLTGIVKSFSERQAKQ